MNIYFNYNTNTYDSSILYRHLGRKSFMAYFYRVIILFAQSHAKKAHTKLQKWRHDICPSNLVTISIIVVHHRETTIEKKANKRKSNICWKQIRTQMERRESFLLIYHAHLLECIQYWYQWMIHNQTNIIDRRLTQMCDKRKETWQL